MANREKALVAREHALRRIAGLVGKHDYKRRATIEARLEQELRRAKALAYFSYTLTGIDEQNDWQLHWRRPKGLKEASAFDEVALLCTNVPSRVSY